jgi:hypothetical protein
MTRSDGLCAEGITKSTLVYPGELNTSIYLGVPGAVFHWKQHISALALLGQVDAIVGTEVERYRVVYAPTGGYNRDNSEPTGKALIVQEALSIAREELQSTVILPDEAEKTLHIPSVIFGQPWELPGLESRGSVEDIEIADPTGEPRPEAQRFIAHNPFEQNLEHLVRLGLIELQEEVFGSEA